MPATAMPRNSLTILHRDEFLVAIDKPSGWLVHRSDIDRHETRIAVQALRDQLGCHVHPVHRLDKGTSGVLLFALDRETGRELGEQFRNGQVGKTYRAVVRGWPPESGRIDHPLRAVDDGYGDGPAGGAPRDAVTEYRRLGTVDLPHRIDRYPTTRYALLSLHPVTGRRHQLRRHLKHISHPIIGDATYGKGRHNRFFQTSFDCHRLLLACVELSFRHPESGEPCTISAPVGGEFAALLDRFGWPRGPAGTGVAGHAQAMPCP